MLVLFYFLASVITSTCLHLMYQLKFSHLYPMCSLQAHRMGLSASSYILEMISSDRNAYRNLSGFNSLNLSNTLSISSLRIPLNVASLDQLQKETHDIQLFAWPELQHIQKLHALHFGIVLDSYMQGHI